MSLTAGDIGFVLYNSDDPDEIGFVALVNINADVVINFTDRGWKSDNTFRIGEGVLTWTAPAGGISAGTVVSITGDGDSATAGTVVKSAGSYGLSTAGDQILAYQGTAEAPTFIAAINNQNADVWAGLGAVQLRLGNADDAMESLEIAIQLDPNQELAQQILESIAQAPLEE